jgi:dihydroneopterin triphosphate diphosphatase
MRQPYQVLILPFNTRECSARYCVFRTRKGRFWQFVAGGGENDETPNQTAHRELLEETGIVGEGLFRLRATGLVPVSAFSEEVVENWGDILFIREYTFAVNIAGARVILSKEHCEYRSVVYDEAMSLLRYSSNKRALQELHQLVAACSGVPAPPF